MDAILYIRWSTKDQSLGDSKARQTKLGEDRAKQHQWLITETLIDHGKSAYHGKNRAAGGALYDIEERAQRGELNGKVLIVEAMDRLSRQEPLESLLLLHQLTKQGLTVCESSTGTIYDSKKITEDWTKLVAVLARAAEAYGSSHEKSQRVASAWRTTQTGQKTKDGVADPRLCPAWIEVGSDGEYKPIAARSYLIARMFDMAADGHGLRSIAKMANEDRAKQGWPEAEWEIRNVGTILRGRRVLGEYQAQRRTIDGKREDIGPPVPLYPAVVSLELWHRVQSGLAVRRSTGGPRKEVVNVLSHLCRCQHINEGENVPCTSRMSYRGFKAQQPRLTCSRFARAAGCTSNATFRYTSLLNGILDELLTLSLPGSLPQIGGLNVPIEKAELQAKQARLAEMADKLMERDDPVLEAAYERFKLRVEQDTRSLRTVLAQSEAVSVGVPPAQLAEQALSLRKEMDDSADARRLVQTALDGIIDTIQMDPKERTSTVVVFGGLHVLRFDKAGKLIGKITNEHMLNNPVIRDKQGNVVVLDSNAEHTKNVMANGDATRLNQLEKVLAVQQSD